MSNFNDCHEITARWEGGWSDHKADPGGKTMYGVTQATLSAWLGRPASDSEIRNLSKATALQIYRKNYWDRIGADNLPPGVDLCVYDFGVNSGPSRAVKSLQAAVGAKADGWVGKETLKAIVIEDRRELINALCDRRLAFLKSLPTWKTFGKGWGNRVADIRKRAMAMAAGGVQPEMGPKVPEGGTAKALPPPPVEKTISTEQKVGAGSLVGAGAVLGFWRDYKDVLTDPAFIGVLLVLGAVAAFLLWRKAKPVEAVE
ncbi:glycosyl hydrolase 108 family protein [Bosea sp. BK604]|uniref:glycoside hydrolase family 108 protein n=1 Tax=Bosea sp. BK604 TaxID=2512180 RepID=UPI00104F54A1|nr:glycosyl hydrolase 108 family protein [Bosea sp. BK604]TCR64700.1 lysozyme family protein [Bosea sp. BK604]